MLRRKNNQRKFFLCMLLLFCVLALLVGSTLAWFISSTTSAVESMDLEVEVDNGMEISADAVHWGSRLNIEDLYKAAGMQVDTGYVSIHDDAGSINQFPEKMNNVSSIGNISDSYRLELFNGVASNVCSQKQADGSFVDVAVKSDDYPTGIDINNCDPTRPLSLGLVKTSKYIESNKACGELANEACDGGVVAFDIYLKVNNASTIALASGSYLKNSKGNDLGLKNTIRIAFVTLGTQPINYYAADIDNIDSNGIAHFSNVPNIGSYFDDFGGYAGAYGARRMNAFGSISIWEPNNGSHAEGGITNAISNYSIEPESINATTALSTDGIYKEITADNLPIRLVNANRSSLSEYFAEQRNATNTDVGIGKPYKNIVKYFKTNGSTLEDNKVLFSVVAGVTKVRVYMWVEGNDVDTENGATSSTIETMLSFTTANTPNEGVLDSSLEVYKENIAPVYREGYSPTVLTGSYTN